MDGGAGPLGGSGFFGCPRCAFSPACFSAPYPVGPGIGHGVDMDLACIIVDSEGDHGLPACRNAAQPERNPIPKAALLGSSVRLAIAASISSNLRAAYCGPA